MVLLIPQPMKVLFSHGFRWKQQQLCDPSACWWSPWVGWNISSFSLRSCSQQHPEACRHNGQCTIPYSLQEEPQTSICLLLSFSFTLSLSPFFQTTVTVTILKNDNPEGLFQFASEFQGPNFVEVRYEALSTCMNHEIYLTASVLFTSYTAGRLRVSANRSSKRWWKPDIWTNSVPDYTWLVS